MRPAQFRKAMAERIAAAHNGCPVGGPRNKKILDRVCHMPATIMGSLHERTWQGEITTTHDDIRGQIIECYGEPCPFTGDPLVAGQMEYDHKNPLARGGDSSPGNGWFISPDANRMKGIMNVSEFTALWNVIQQFPNAPRKWVKKKLKQDDAQRQRDIAVRKDRIKRGW